MNSNSPPLHLPWRRLLSPIILLLALLPPATALNRDGVLLLSFRYEIISDPLNLLVNWSFNDDTPCNWYGITCSPAGDSRVTGVSLPNSNLSGSISPNLGYLDQLQSLNLSSNSFYGALQSDFFRLSELRQLDLSSNVLSGDIPAGIGQLLSLQFLNLSDNSFVGEFPSQLAGLGNLTVISLRSNKLSGKIPTGLDRVQVLDLSSNSFNGSIGSDFVGRSIQYFNISNNQISGEIPTDFSKSIPENATLDFSYNNLTGNIPDSDLFLNQKAASFSGNPGLCGDPLTNPCPISSSPTSLPSTFGPNTSPAIAAMPDNINSQPAEGAEVSPPPPNGGSGMKPLTIAVIVAGDLAGILILALVLFLVYRFRRKGGGSKDRDEANAARTDRAWSPTSSLTSSETKGFTKWSCLGKHKGGGDEDEQSSSSSELACLESNSEAQNAAVCAKEGQSDAQTASGTLVTVDGGESGELEVETLLKASAFILGGSGPSIVYKAVLEDGSALAVRRIGEGSADRLKDFESQIRSVAKVASGHPNLVQIRGFYWAADEKLVIYEFVPNGSLANARYRKGGTSPCHLPWEYRLKIAKGVARGLSYLHDKKHVHGNLKPSNILLDLEMEPKIADFGLDRLESGHKTGISTRHFGSKRSTCSRDSFQDAASFGPSPSPSASSIGCGSPYYPPESLRSLKPTGKWDVYAFGVVLIELLTGRVAGLEELSTWVVGLNMGEDDLDKSRILRMADLAIRADLEGMEDTLLTCLKLGCGCASSLPHKRPSMKEALHVLDKLPTSSSSPYF